MWRVQPPPLLQQAARFLIASLKLPPEQTQQMFVVYPRKIYKQSDQSFAALRLKWSSSLYILRYQIDPSAVFARLLS